MISTKNGFVTNLKILNLQKIKFRLWGVGRGSISFLAHWLQLVGADGGRKKKKLRWQSSPVLS